MNNPPNVVYFRELFDYSKENILEKLNNDTLNKLQEYDFIVNDDGNLKFKYVGVIIVDNTVIYVYPKYIPNENNIKNDFKEILNVIKKYNSENKDSDYENEENDDISFNILSMMIYLIEDYYENGVYTNFQKLLKVNGDGEINWDKTINNNYPLIIDNKPYYMELYTDFKINDMYYYFRLLHECIITECAKFLKNLGLLEVFDLTYVELSEKDLEDFGDVDYIVNKIEKELYVEFNSHKQNILRFMKAYVSKRNLFSEKHFLILYGTSYYQNIWEEMCSQVFANKLNLDLNSLDLQSQLNGDYIHFNTLNDVIEKPKWILNDGTIKEPKRNKLKPDIITFVEDTFIILDAKYYDLIFERDKKLENQPGISDITKQYLYQLSFEDFRRRHGFNKVKNALLFPKYSDGIENKGHVKLDIFSNLEEIGVVMIPASMINKRYLDNDYFGENDLKEIFG